MAGFLLSLAGKKGPKITIAIIGEKREVMQEWGGETAGLGEGWG